MNTILRQDVMALVLSGEPFDMIWITADRRRGTGGDIISAEGWLVVSEKTKESNESNESNKSKETDNQELVTDRKDPHHPENGTVNVFNPHNRGHHITTVHWDLIQFFNGKRLIN